MPLISDPNTRNPSPRIIGPNVGPVVDLFPTKYTPSLLKRTLPFPHVPFLWELVVKD